MNPALLCRPLAQLAAVAFLLVTAAVLFAVQAAPPAPKVPDVRLPRFCRHGGAGRLVD